MAKRRIVGDREFAEAVGERVQKLRADRKLSQAALALAVDVEPHTLSRWERGVRPIPLVMLRPVAHVLGVRVADLVDIETIALPEPSKADALVLAKWHALDDDQRALMQRVLDINGVPRRAPKPKSSEAPKIKPTS